jgi:hypothetical protein
MAASTDSNTKGGLPIVGRPPLPSSRAMPLSTMMRRASLSGKWAAREMDSRPEAECPTTIGRSHFSSPMTARVSPILASTE